MERRARAGERDASRAAAPGSSSPGRTPRRRRARQPTIMSREQPADAADVGEREHERAAVARASARAPASIAVRRRHDRAVGVPRALGVGGRARRVEDPPHRRVVARSSARPAAGGERRRVAVGQRPVADEHLEAGLLARRSSLRHRLEVEALPLRRDDEQLRAGLLGDEADLALAVDRAASGSAPRRGARARRRARSTRSRSGSCHETCVPSPTPSSASPAAARSAASRYSRERQRAPVLVDRRARRRAWPRRAARSGPTGVRRR